MLRCSWCDACVAAQEPAVRLSLSIFCRSRHGEQNERAFVNGSESEVGLFGLIL